MQKKKSTASSSTSHVGAKWVGCLKDDVCVFKCIKKKQPLANTGAQIRKGNGGKVPGQRWVALKSLKKQQKTTVQPDGQLMLIVVLRLCVTSVNVLLRRFSNTLFYFLFMD